MLAGIKFLEVPKKLTAYMQGWGGFWVLSILPAGSINTQLLQSSKHVAFWLEVVSK